jgi:hypothetical protein
MLPGANAINTNSAKGYDSASSSWRAYQLSEVQLRTQLNLPTSDFVDQELQGKSIPTLYSTLDDVHKTSDKYISNSLKEASSLNALASKTKDAGARYVLQNTASDIVNKAQSVEIQSNEMAHSLFAQNQQAHSVDFDRSVFGATYSGASAKSMTGMIQDRMGNLLSVAKDPKSPLNDAERINYLLQAKKLDVQNKQDIYRQEEGENSVGIAKAQLGVANASLYGSPTQERAAQSVFRSSLQSEQQQLNKELAEGNLSYDQRLLKMQQIAGLQTQITQNEVSSRRTFFAQEEGMASDGFSASVAGMGRQIRRGGNAAVNTSTSLSSLDQQIRVTQDSLAGETPENQAKIRKDLANLQEQRAAYLETTNTYSPNSRDQQSDITLHGQVRRSMLMPYNEGPDSNKFVVSKRLMSFDKSQLAKLNANRKSKIAAGSWHDEDETTFTGQREGFLNDIADAEYSQRYELFNAIPEFIAGAPMGGVGVSILPTAALAAQFSPNPTVGRFGGKSAFNPSSLSRGFGPGSVLHGTSSPVEGGSQGSFLNAAEKGSNVILGTIAAGIEKTNQLLSTLARGRNDSRPVNDVAGQVNHALGNSFNTNRPGQ